jgi:hypothetical protein
MIDAAELRKLCLSFPFRRETSVLVWTTSDSGETPLAHPRMSKCFRLLRLPLCMESESGTHRRQAFGSRSRHTPVG